jgi:hypothetical protein
MVQGKMPSLNGTGAYDDGNICILFVIYEMNGRGRNQLNWQRRKKIIGGGGVGVRVCGIFFFVSAIGFCELKSGCIGWLAYLVI